MDNALVIANGKGGVLKTTLVAHVAGLAAVAGWRVLAVDLDPQGNLARDLGYVDRSDAGRALFDAVRRGEPLEPLRGVRDGLDVVAAGDETADLALLLGAGTQSAGESAFDRLGEVLTPLGSDYDLVVIDTPPANPVLVRAALRFCRWVVIPTLPDSASIDGMGRVWADLRTATTVNPDVEVLGVALTLLQAGASAVARDARADLDEILMGKVPVFTTTIRIAQSVARACRERGILANEYERDALQSEPWYKAHREGRKHERYSAAASSLATEYQALVDEILAAVTTSMASASQ